MKFRLFLIVLSLCMCSSSVYGQGGKSVYLKDLSGVLKQGNYYEVVGNVNLKGNTLVIPKDSKVVFKGGKITNGTVVLDETQLEGDVCIDCDIQGTITNTEIKASWFGLQSGSTTDQTKAFQRIIDLYESNVSHNSWDINLENPEPTIIIPAGKYYLGEVKLRSYLTIKGAGRGSTELHGVTFSAGKQYNITIEDLSIVGDVAATKNIAYDLETGSRKSAFKLRDCARLIFKNICVRNYNVAFDNYNTYLVDLYSCFVCYCNVCYLNDGKGEGYGGHAVRWFGGEMSGACFSFVQKNGSSVFLNGATIEGCKYGIYLVNPSSFIVNACYFEGNNFDIYGNVVHTSIENNLFSEFDKKEGDAYIYATGALGFTIIQGNAFGKQIGNTPHVLVDEKSKIYGNIVIGQNDIIHGGRIPVSDRLLSYVFEKGSNKFYTYLPDAEDLLIGQTVVYQDSKTGILYLLTRDTYGNLKYLPFNDFQK